MRKNTNKREDFNTNKFDCTIIQKVSENWVIQNNPFLYFSSCCNPFFLKNKTIIIWIKQTKLYDLLTKIFTRHDFSDLREKKINKKTLNFFLKKLAYFSIVTSKLCEIRTRTEV